MCDSFFICNESIRNERIFWIDSFLKKEPRESIRLDESDFTSLFINPSRPTVGLELYAYIILRHSYRSLQFKAYQYQPPPSPSVPITNVLSNIDTVGPTL